MERRSLPTEEGGVSLPRRGFISPSTWTVIVLHSVSRMTPGEDMQMSS